MIRNRRTNRRPESAGDKVRKGLVRVGDLVTAAAWTELGVSDERVEIWLHHAAQLPEPAAGSAR